MSPASKAQQRANAKYNLKAYDRIELKVPKGRKSAIQAVAAAQGESLNTFAVTAINERIERLGGSCDDVDVHGGNSISDTDVEA